MVLSGIAFAVVFEFYMALLRCHQFHHFFIHLFSFKMMGTKIPLDSSRLSLWSHVLQMRLDMALTRCHQFGIAKHSALITVFCTLNSPRLSLWSHVLQMRLDMALARCHQFITGHLHVAILHSSTTLPPIHSCLPFIHFSRSFKYPMTGADGTLGIITVFSMIANAATAHNDRA